MEGATLTNFKPQTPQGDGNYLEEVPFVPIFPDFKPQTPQGDGNWSPIPMTHINKLSFQTTNPARGRKHSAACHSRQTADRISNHKPRKGTETFEYHSLHSSKSAISNHKPRKGTETPTSFQISLPLFEFQTTNPARGRKHLCCSNGITIVGARFQTTNPARGRKRPHPCRGYN